MIALGFIFVFCFFFIGLPLVMYHKDEDAKKIKLKFITFFSFVISIFICFFIGNITEYFIFLESTLEK